jgi:hypothetical protein
MHHQADLSIETIDAPEDLRCEFGPHSGGCGHTAPTEFRGEPTKFYRISAKCASKVICEPCLIIANHLAKVAKEKRLAEQKANGTLPKAEF